MRLTPTTPPRPLRWLGWPLTALLLGACTSTQPVADEHLAADELKIESIRERHDFAAGIEKLVVINEYGEINVRSMKSMAVGVQASAQIYGADGPRPRIEFRQEGPIATLTVIYDDTRARYRGRPGRLDLAVFVPTLKFLDLQARDDRIQAKRYAGNLTARTKAGQIQAGSYGRLDLRSDSGEIRAMLLAPAAAQDSHVVSSALVEVLFPARPELALDVRSAGIIENAVQRADQDPDPHRLWSPGDSSAGSLQVEAGEAYLRPLHLE